MSGRDVPWFAVINLGNSIIGVSILAMPWCFRECGVLLATLLILFVGFLTKVSCNLLLRASKATRRNSYEYLAYHTLGATGKLVVEMSIIGLLVSTCVAFFVIMGDLGPAIVSKWGGFQNNWELRVCLLVFMALVIVLPLGLRRSVESLSNISTLSITFYILFSSDIIFDSLPTLMSGVWTKDLVLWRSAGTLKGLSIFALAFSCQTVLFVVYESLPERTPKQMESVVNRAVGLVSTVYIVVGFFGYVTFNQTGIKGDILLNFAPGLMSEVLRLGFTLSVALSFPLVIFPCRASIYTLLFSQSHSLENPHGGGGDREYIPPSMFKIITLILVVFTLILGITIPNVETILGLTGATLGCLICFVFPALIYLRCTGVPNRNTAKVVLALGLLLLVCSTYDNLQSMQKEADIDINKNLDINEELKMLEAAANKNPFGKADVEKSIGRVDDDKTIDKLKEGQLDVDPNQMIEKGEEEKKPDKDKQILDKIDELAREEGDREEVQLKEHLKVVNEKRQEPPIPHAPDDKVEALQEDVDDNEEEEEEEKRVIDIVQQKEKDEIEAAEKDLEREEKKKVVEEEKIKEEKKEDAKKAILEKIVDDKVIEQEVKQEEQDKQLKEIKKDIDQASLEKIVEEKVVEHEIKQEEQEKQLKEIKEQQKRQEEVINQQREEIEKLRIQHEEEQIEKEKEKEQKEKEEKEKLAKEKEEVERKAKQDSLLKQQEELQKQQIELQQQQQFQQQQQQLQQQLPGDQFQPQVGVGIPQQGGAVLPPVGVPQDGLQQQPAGGFINQGLQQQQQLGMGGVLQQVGGQQPVVDGGVMQQQPLVPQQQLQAQMGQQQVAVGIPQQAGVGGQPLMQQQPLGGQPLVQQQVEVQMPLQDLNMQQGLQGGLLNQQVAGQGNIPIQQQQILDQPNLVPLDRVQRSPQDGLLQQQGVGIPQQDMGVQGQQLQVNNQQQENQPLWKVPVVQLDPGLQQQAIQQQALDQQQHLQQAPDQQQIVNQQMLQQKQLDQIPKLGQNDLPNLNNLAVDSKAVNRQLQIAADLADNHVNRQLKHADVSAETHVPKTNDQMLSHVTKDTHANAVNFDSKDEARLNKERIAGEVGDFKQDVISKENAKQDTNVQHQVLVDEKEDGDMELAKSLEQQLNNQFKQVGVMAQPANIKPHSNTKRKEEVKR